MSAAIPQPSGCDTTCSSAIVTQIPGVAGNDGTDGSAGASGISSYSYVVTNSYVQPAVNANVTVTVSSSAWMTVGQVVYVQNGGYYSVQVVPTDTSVTLKNLGYTGNAAPAVVVAVLNKVSPGGIKGTDGVAVGVTLNSISPTTTKGDLLVDNGANSPSASLIRFGVGANNTVLTADSAQASGQIWKVPKLTATATLDFPSIAATGGTQDLTIALASAAVGDPVTVSPPAAIEVGLALFAFVSAPAVVTVRLVNCTAAPIDPASGSYTVRINKL